MQMNDLANCPTPRERIVPVFSPSINSGTEFLSTLPKPKTIPARTILLEQNQRPSFVFVIRSGIVKLTCISEDGQESLLGLRSEGWWAGAPVALLNVPSIITVTTVTSCSVASIPMSEFSQLLIQNQRMLRHFIASQSRELMVEQMHGIMQTCSAATRLSHLEDELENSAWKTVDPSSVMRQGEIAKLLDISPEHLSRLLHKRKIRLAPKRAAHSEPKANRVA
jgi:CRP/FNR family transcriptional regulator